MHNIESIIILDEENPISKKILEVDGKFQIDLKSELDRYIYNSSQALSALRAGINKSRLSLSLLNIEHLECIEDEGLSRSSYIEMLIENSIIRVQSVYDRLLIFINKALDLGISNEQISHTAIVTNEWVIRFDIVKKIKSINKKCYEYRHIRNKVIHHDRYTEEELDKIILLMETNELLAENGDEQLVSQEIIELMTSDYLDTKEEELTSYLNTIEQKIFELYDSLIIIYNYKKRILRTT